MANMNESIARDLYDRLSKSRLGWAVIVLFLAVGALFVVWAAIPEKIKVDWISGQPSGDPLSDAHPKSPPVATPLSSKSTLEPTLAASRRPVVEATQTDLSASQIRQRIDRLLSEEKFTEAAGYAAKLPSPTAQDEELKRIFNKAKNGGAFDAAQEIVPLFIDAGNRTKAQSDLNQELSKQ